MTGEMATQCTWLWPLAWQSTICLAAGIGASIILRRRATRAHQVLLLAILAAAIIPALASVVKHNQWGLFEAERTAPRHSTGFQPSLNDVTETQAATRSTASDKPTAITQPPKAVGSHDCGRGPDQLLLAAWLAAGSILLLRLGARFTLGLRLASRSGPVHCALLEDALRRAREKLGVDGEVVLRCSDDVRSPVIWCWNRRPILLISRDASEKSSLDWESILCHELAHWKRCDHVSGLLAELLVCILPWQPLLWWARERLMDLSEEACDDWVIASGQTTTRYARTLLGLTPQGYAALVPAVVAGKSSLGARVRRIVAGHCGDPRNSLRWTLIVVAVTACLSLGIALAQTRPALAGITNITALGGGAVIEQVASAHTLKGRVLDPNGNPAGQDDDVRVTALPGTCYVVKPDAEGCFELAWSPDFTADGQKPRLLARNIARNLACLVEIPAPPTPVTVQLEPGLTITGRVADPNGRPIPKALTMLSLADRFTCQAPLAAAGTDENGQFRIQAVPCGQAYAMTVWAEGHVTSTAHLDATNAPTRTLDAGTITPASQSPGKSDRDQSPNPNWKKDFLQTYRLGEGEVLKFIKPPFVPARQDHLINCFLSYGVGSAMENLCCVSEDAMYVCAGYRWDDRLGSGPLFCGPSTLRLQAVLNWILEIPDYDVSPCKEMDDVALQKGDWIVRKETPVEERLKALEQILAAESHRFIRFERRTTERDTIVVTGRYAFTPLPDRDPNRLMIFAEDGKITPIWSAETCSLSQAFDRLSDGIDIAIANKCEIPEESIPCTFCPSLLTIHGHGIDKEKELPLLLDNLARQTGLQFKVERRSAPMWFVVERTDSSSQGS